MTAAGVANRHDVVLVGGGHTNVQVMTDFAMRPMQGVRLTLVTDRLLTPYSGMLPGHVAGLYTHDEMHIDLARLAQATGVRLVHAPATGIDRAARHVLFGVGPPLAYDTLSIDVGITPDLSAIEGAAEHAVAVKPISRFLMKLDGLLADAGRPDGLRRIAVVGGGAAGFELACALRARLAQPAGSRDEVAIALLTHGGLLPTLHAGVRRRAAAALTRLKVELVEDFRAVRIAPDGVAAKDGRFHSADAVLVSTGARAPVWLAASGLPCAPDGSVQVRPTLQALDDDAVFAVGDCAVVVDDPRPKAGVFAVRQGPKLARNIRLRVAKQRLLPHRAQRAFLTLLSTGDGRAIAGRGGWFALEGRWVWRWKDHIDRAFMDRFSTFAASGAPVRGP